MGVAGGAGEVIFCERWTINSYWGGGCLRYVAFECTGEVMLLLSCIAPALSLMLHDFSFFFVLHAPRELFLFGSVHEENRTCSIRILLRSSSFFHPPHPSSVAASTRTSLLCFFLSLR